MSFPSRLQIGLLVSAATLIVCSLGVRAELKSAQNSIAEHRLQAPHAPEVARSIVATREAESLNPPPR
jgi:hypothetical protein